MKHLFLLVFTIGFLHVKAQQDTIMVFRMAPGYHQDPERAHLKQKVTQKGDLWELTLYQKKNQPEEIITYSDPNLQVRAGAYLRYKEGRVVQKGIYEKGYRVGSWETFYASGALKESFSYLWDQPNGSYISYWENGQVQKKGHYTKGKPSGRWILFYEKGKPLAERSFNEVGELIQQQIFQPDGQLASFSPLLSPSTYPEGEIVFLQRLQKKLKATGISFHSPLPFKLIIGKNGVVQSVTSSSEKKMESAQILSLIRTLGKWNAAHEFTDPITTEINLTLPVAQP